MQFCCSKSLFNLNVNHIAFSACLNCLSDIYCVLMFFSLFSLSLFFLLDCCLFGISFVFFCPKGLGLLFFLVLYRQWLSFHGCAVIKTW